MKKISYVLVLLILLVFCYQNIQAYEEYQVGRKVIYNDEDYYVIRKSDKNKKYVTLIRNRPLSMQELIEYGSDVQNSSYAAKVTYVSPDVYIPANNYRNNYLYADSYVKSLVDYWMENYLNMDDLVIDSNGYKARIIDNSDLSALEYVVTPYYYQNGPEIHIRGFTYNLDGSEKPWLNYNNENMLTSIFFEDHTMSSPSSDRYEVYVYYYDPSSGNFLESWSSLYGIVRPVINLKKTAIPGQTDYSTGAEITYKNEKYNIIRSENDYVVVLKWEPLSKTTVNNATNDMNGVISYYSSDTCSYSANNYTGCTNDYDQSNVKKIVDNWANSNFDFKDLIEVDGYSDRIIMRDDLVNHLGYRDKSFNSGSGDVRLTKTEDTPTFMFRYNNDPKPYWFINNNDNSSLAATVLDYSSNQRVYEYSQVRPVINLNKCSLDDDACTDEDAMVCKEGTTPVTEKVIKYINLPGGTRVKVNNELYYVVKTSSKFSKNVLLMKDEPLSKEVVNKYINQDLYVSQDGEVPYVLNGGCYFRNGDPENPDYATPGCVLTPFNNSTVKDVLYGWANDSFEPGVLQEVDNYKVRLLSLEEAINEFGFTISTNNTSGMEVYHSTSYTPNLLTDNSKYSWSMTSGDSGQFAYNGNSFEEKYLRGSYPQYLITNYLRPVIVIDKKYVEGSFIEDDVIVGCITDDGEIIPVDPPVDDDSEDEIVEVANTISNKSIISLIVSLILMFLGVTLLIYNLYNKKRKN